MPPDGGPSLLPGGPAAASCPPASGRPLQPPGNSTIVVSGIPGAVHPKHLNRIRPGVRRQVQRPRVGHPRPDARSRLPAHRAHAPVPAAHRPERTSVRGAVVAVPRAGTAHGSTSPGVAPARSRAGASMAGRIDYSSCFGNSRSRSSMAMTSRTSWRLTPFSYAHKRITASISGDGFNSPSMYSKQISCISYGCFP